LLRRAGAGEVMKRRNGMTEMLPTSTLISHYRILNRLGAGGMGEVYLAEDTRLGRKVALKLLPEHFTKDEDRVQRFEQEARAASVLNHPNIITIYEIGQASIEAGGAYFIATEFIEGQTLHQQMIGARLKSRTTLDLAVQVASALKAAHAAGIVHRDIKPENIMVRPDGLVKVVDFGVAKLTELGPATSDTEAPTALSGTSPGMVLGTARYMSPEQARGLDVDQRSDLFSLGIVLYEMVAGRAPFTGTTIADILVSILQTEPLPLTQYFPDLPAELERIVTRCLKKDRASRYQSAQELLTDLKSLAGALSQLQPAPKSSPSIAVLPFVNMSADAENEYFCDGLAEELSNALAKIEALHVAARTSAFSFKGKENDVREIGRKLNVSAVLEGSVRKSGSRLRVTAQLINVADGYHL
jgi:eukaryotic-like serine/threonine-protein kinase